MKTVIETKLLEALRDLDQAVASLKGGGPKPDLLAHFAKIDALTESLPKGTDGELLHFLHKKSYQKALLHLEAGKGAAERGACG